MYMYMYTCTYTVHVSAYTVDASVLYMHVQCTCFYMRDEKKEASKIKQTNKAKQHMYCTCRSVVENSHTCPFILSLSSLYSKHG